MDRREFPEIGRSGACDCLGKWIISLRRYEEDTWDATFGRSDKTSAGA